MEEYPYAIVDSVAEPRPKWLRTLSRPSASGTAKPTARPTPIFSQGEVVRVPFPHTNRTTRQRHPALVVSAGHLGRDGTLLWVAMITSAENAPWPHDVSLSAELEQTGLKASSVVRPSKLAIIEASHAEPLGDVGRGLLEMVLRVVGERMGISARV